MSAAKINFLLLIFLSLLLASCGENSEEIAMTMVAQTQEKAEADFTQTPVPTETLVPSETPLPTKTPTLTPTPGPIVLFDDFSSRSDIWGECTVCTWENGTLYLGPYPPTSNLAPYMILCEGCGTPLFYRMAVDVQWIEGQADRGYGFVTKLNRDEIDVLEISSLQIWGYFSYDLHRKSWGATAFDITGQLNPSTQVNHIEFVVEPVGGSTANIFIRFNNKNVQIYYNQPVTRNQVGLEVGFHSIGVGFDNFEFEEIEYE